MWTWIKDKTTLSSAFISIRTSDRNSTGIQVQCSDSLHPQRKTSCTFAVCFANVVFLPAFKTLQSFVRLNQCLLSKSWIITALLSWPASQWTVISVCINWCLWFFSLQRYFSYFYKTACHLMMAVLLLSNCQTNSDPDYILTHITRNQMKSISYQCTFQNVSPWIWWGKHDDYNSWLTTPPCLLVTTTIPNVPFPLIADDINSKPK